MLNSEQYQSEGYIETQADTKTYFIGEKLA